MTDDELKLFGIAEWSKPYAYADISTSSITSRTQVLLLPTVWSSINNPLAWAGLAAAEEGNGEVCMEGNLCQRLSPTSIPPSYNIIYCH